MRIETHNKMKTRTEIERELRRKYNGYHPELWTDSERCELEAVKAANRALTGGRVSINLPAPSKVLSPEVDPALGVAAEILALFPQRTKAGRPKRASRYGFFVLGDGGDLFYYEPHHGVQEFHGNIIEDKFDEKELLDFFADFED